jgi:hypothetical protein
MGWLGRAALVAALLAGAGCGGESEAPAPKAAAAKPAAQCAELTALRGTVEAAFSGQQTAAPRAQLDALAQTAPAEIRPDIATIADAYGKLMTALEGLQTATDPAALEELEKTVGGLDQQKLVGANERVTAWVSAHC